MAQRHSSHFLGDSPQALLLSARWPLLPEKRDRTRDAKTRRNKIPYQDVAQSLLTLSNLLTFLGLPNFWPILFTFPHVDYLPLSQITLERGLCLAKALRTQNYFSQIHTSLQSLLTCPSLSPNDKDKGTSHKDTLHFLPSKQGLNKDREGSEAGSETLSKS